MTANPRRDPHRYRGPKVGTDGHTYAYACACGAIGPERHSRAQAKADHLVHRQREARELREDIQWDRDAGVDL